MNRIRTICETPGLGVELLSTLNRLWLEGALLQGNYRKTRVFLKKEQRRRIRDQSGTSKTEYALILALLLVTAMVANMFLEKQINWIIQEVMHAIQDNWPL